MGCHARVLFRNKLISIAYVATKVADPSQLSYAIPTLIFHGWSFSNSGNEYANKCEVFRAEIKNNFYTTNDIFLFLYMKPFTCKKAFHFSKHLNFPLRKKP